MFGLLCLGVVGLSAPHPAQDGLSFVAAAQLALDGQAGGYPIGEAGLEFSVAYERAYCDGVENCDEIIVPFLSPPPMLVLMAPLLLTGVPILLLRLLGALSLGLGAWVLYGKLRETPALVRAFPASLLLCMPLAVAPIENGQNSPWLFLTLAVGMVATAPAGALLAACALAKLSPVALAVVWMLDRDWRALGIFAALAAVGVVAALPLPDTATWPELLPELGGLAASHPENISVHALFGPIWIAAVAIPTLALFPRLETSDRWALLWLAWLVAIPLVWTHYLWVGFGALWWLVGRRLTSETPAFALAAWCASAAFFGTWASIWLVVTWVGVLAALYRSR